MWNHNDFCEIKTIVFTIIVKLYAKFRDLYDFRHDVNSKAKIQIENNGIIGIFIAFIFRFFAITRETTGRINK